LARSQQAASTPGPLFLGNLRQKGSVLPQRDDGNGYCSLLDYEAAAAYLSTTPRNVRELWARRQPAAVKVERCVRLTKEDFDALVAANRVGAPRSMPNWPR
jgi:hypothetical protein